MINSENQVILSNLLDLLNKNGWVKVPLCSESMEPTLHKSEIITIKQSKGSLEKGDIIAYIVDKSHITVHRIMECRNSLSRRLYLTKGDNNKFCDSYLVSDEIIIGVVEKK